MSAAKTKLTRAEVCAELARQVGWRNVKLEGDGYFGELPCGDVWNHVPDFFVSRDAAAELVTWIEGQIASDRFVDELYKLSDKCEERLVYSLLLATPEQITLAACKALNIEVE